MEIDLKSLAQHVGGRLDGPESVIVTGVAGVNEAGDGDCTFVSSGKYLDALRESGASAVILSEGVETSIPAIRVENPELAFLLAIRFFERPRSGLFEPGVHPSAIVDPSAKLGEGVHVGPGACIGKDCEVGDRSIVGANCVLMAEVIVGEDTLLYPNVSVREETRIGSRVIVHCGAVLGSDGFGFSREKAALHKIPQIGRVEIGDDVEIGANTCVDRATTGVTRIDAFTKLDNLVQIGHNVRIGQRTALSSQTGISGSTTIGDDVIAGGQVGVADHATIGNGVMIVAKSGIRGVVPDNSVLAGVPAADHREWRRLLVHYSRLGRYAEEITDLKRRIEELENR